MMINLISIKQTLNRRVTRDGLLSECGKMKAGSSHMSEAHLEVVTVNGVAVTGSCPLPHGEF